MKKIILAALILSISSTSFAYDIWRSSNTATADTTKNLCLPRSSLFPSHAILHAVCVNTGAAGTLTVYASSGSATSPIAAINTAAVIPCAVYDVAVSSGLTYTNSATANVTILYQCQ